MKGMRDAVEFLSLFLVPLVSWCFILLTTSAHEKTRDMHRGFFAC